MDPTLTPSAPQLATGSDTGVSDTDDLTNSANPTVTGTAVANATVKLYDTDGKTVLGTAVAGPTGAYFVTPTTSLDDGDHVLSVTATAAGFAESSPSQGFDVTIDTAAPAAPSAPALMRDSDTGASALDGLTSATSPTLIGAAEPGATMQLFDNGGANPIGTAVADGDGAYSINAGTLSEGVHDLTVTATDAAGNESASSAVTPITIDTTPPATPAAPILSPISDTGMLHTDGNTSDRALVVTGTAEAGAKIRLLVSDTEATAALVGFATADASGAYAITTTPLPDGPNALTVVATDAAGNVSAASAPLNILIDTSGGTATSTPLAATDNATQVNFHVHFNQAVSDVSPSDFALSETGSAFGVVQNATGSGQDYTVSVTGLGGDGGVALDLTGAITDTAGNAVTFTESNVHLVSDTTVPSTISVSGDLGGGLGSPSATGRAVAFDSDNGGLVAGGPAGTASNVYVKDLVTGATLLVTSGIDGDANGDSGEPSLSKNATVIAFESDATNLVPGGTAPGQLNTYIARLSRISQAGGPVLAVVPGSIALVSQGNGQEGGGVAGVGPVLSGDGKYVAFSSTAALLPGVESGIANVYLENIDTGGLTLVSAGTGQNEYVRDTSSSLDDPTAGQLIPAPDRPPGQGGSDDSSVTSISPTPSGVEVAYDSYATDLGGAPLTPGSTLEAERSYVFNATTGKTTVLDGVGSVGADNATDHYATFHPNISGNGNYVGYTVQYGENVSTVYEENLVTGAVNQITPTYGDYADDASLSDGGSYVLFVGNLFGHDPSQPADELTLFNTSSNTTTSLGQESDGQVPKLTDDGNAVVFNGGDNTDPNVYETSLGVSVGINPIGSADVVNPAELNQIKADGGLAISGPTNAPIGSAVLVRVGDAATETFSGAVAGAVTGNGVWTAVIPADRLSDLKDDLYVITAQIGTSTGATVLAPRFFNIETTPPPAPDAPVLAAQSDTGAAHSGVVTDQDQPVVRGLAQADATVTLYDSDAPSIAIGTGVADANGVYAITTTQQDGVGLTQGLHSLFVTATDSAGNVSAASATLGLTVDTLAPDQPGLPTLAAGSDTGESSVDGVTNVAQPIVTGKAEAGATVTLYDSDAVAVLGAATADAHGDYSITSSALTDGPHQLSVTATDAAGNVSARSQAISLTLDTEPPAAPSLQSITGSVVSPGELAPEVEVAGVAEPFSTVLLHVDGDTGAVGRALADAFGSYTILDSDPLQAGAHTLTVTAIDQAGNESQPSLPKSVTISGVDVAPPNQITVDDGVGADGYIAGATVFGDANGNGVLDPGEVHTVTNLSGLYRSYASTTLVLTGGVDVSTGLTLPGVLKAPQDSHAITALTTFLVAYQSVAPAGLDKVVSEEDAATALGLTSINQFQDDPIADALAGAPAPQIMNAKLSDMAVDFSAVIAGAGGDASVAFSAVFDAAARAALTKSPVNLNDPATLSAILVDAASQVLPGVTLSSAVVAAAGQVVAAGNVSLDQLQDSFVGAGLLTILAGDEFVAQSSAAAALGQAAQAPGLLPGVVSAYTGSSLTSAEAAADAQTLGAPQLTYGSDTGLSHADNIIDTLTPTFTGTARPGSTVILADNNYQNRLRTAVVIGEGVADATGHYTIRASALTVGDNQVFVQTEPAGSALAVGATFAVPDPLPFQSTDVDVETLAYVNALPPDIQGVSSEVGPGNDATHSSLLVYGDLSGAGLPLITVYADGNPTPIGSGLGTAGGLFGIRTSALSAGPHVLTVTSTQVSGATTTTSAPFSVTVTAPVVATSAVDGAGAIVGATAFYVTDNGYIAPTAREVSATTSDQGAVSLPIDRSSPAITVLGGWDTLTDLPLGGGAPDLGGRDGTSDVLSVYETDSLSKPPELLAPPGSAEVTPLTSLVAVAPFVTTATADQTLAAALGLNGADLLSLDPLKAALAGDSQPFLASAKVMDTAVLESALLGFSFKALSSALLSGSFNLDSESDIISLLQGQYRFNANAPDTAFLTAVATVIAASNADIDAHAASAPGDELAYTLAAEVQAQTITASAIADTFTAVQDLPDQDPSGAAAQIATLEAGLVQTYTGAALSASVTGLEAQSTQVLDFGPAGAASSNASIVHFTLTFSAPVGGLSASDFSVVDGAGLSNASIVGVTAASGAGGETYDIAVQTGIGTGALSLNFAPTGVTDGLGEPLTSGLFESPLDTNPVTVRGLTADRAIGAGDFNGDGRPDLVAIYTGSQSDEANLTVFLNLGGGKVAAQPSIYVPLALDAVTVGDANGDGATDLIVGGLATGAGASGGIDVLAGNGDGTFQNATNVSNVQATTLAVGAFDGTGRLDIVANVLTGSTDAGNLQVSGTLQILLGHADGTFQAGPALSLGAGASVSQILVGDLNGDGVQDIVALDAAHGAIDVFLGNGDGTFEAPVVTQVAGAGQLLSSIAVGDLNGDGLADIVATVTHDSNNLVGVRSVDVLLGAGGGAFQPAKTFIFPNSQYGDNRYGSSFLASFSPTTLSIADINNDGKADVVVGGQTGTIVLVGQGDGSLTLGEQMTVGNNASGDDLTTVDLNQDGRTDIVTAPTGADGENEGVGVLLNAPTTVLSATSTPITITRSALANPLLTLAAGQASLSRDGQTYTLDLGTLTQGQAAAALQVALTNFGYAPTDSLEGQFSALVGGGFTVSGASLPTALATGQGYSGLTVTADTNAIGAHSATLTFSPRDVSATTTTYTPLLDGDTALAATNSVDGATVAGELPPITLVITDTVVANTTPVESPAILEVPGSLMFGNARMGDTPTQALAIENAAAVPAEALTVAATATGGATVAGSVSGLAPGATDDQDIVVGLDTAAAGAVVGSVVLTPTSVGDSGSPTARPSASVAVSGTVFRTAQAQATPISEIIHVNDPGTAALKVANSAAADGYSEDLLSSVASATGEVAGEGASGDIAPGADSGGDLRATFSTAQAGTIAGTVTLSLTSDGGTGPGAIDGLGQLALPSQSVAVNVTVDNYAQVSVISHTGVLTPGSTANSYVLDLGTVQLGATAVSVDLAALNSAIGQADTLGGAYAISGDAAFVNSGFSAFTGDAAGQSDAGGLITLKTDEAGAFTETVVLKPTGGNSSGYQGALPTQTVTITGKVAAPTEALAILDAPATITLGAARVGGTLSQPLAVENAAEAPAAALAVSATDSGDATVTGSISGLDPGSSDDQDIVVGLGTGVAGAVSGALALAATSVGESGSTTALPAASVAVSGAVFRTAEASAAPISEIIHVNDPGTATLNVANTAAADGYSENLLASAAGATGAIVGEGTSGEIAPGADSGGALQATFSTAQAGLINGTVALSLTSDGGTGPGALDGLGQVALPSQNVAVNVTVDNYAQVGFVSHKGVLTPGAPANSYVLNLGTVQIGATPIGVDLAALNKATGQADTLNGAYMVSGDGAFTNTGFGAFNGDAAGQSDAGGVVTLNTNKVGTFTETVVLTSTGGNSSGYSGALPTQTVTINGTVAPVTGSGVGDVHIVTFDGLHYDFQAVGDFTLAQTSGSDPAFLVQIRTAEWEDEGSLTTLLAAQVGADVVRFGATGTGRVSIDGVDDVTLMIGQAQTLAEGTLTKTSTDTYRLVWASGETLNVTDRGHYLDETISLGSDDPPGSVEGLLGADEGQASDFRLRDGTVLKSPVSSAELLGEFADAWRVTPDFSILSAPAPAPAAVILFSQFAANIFHAANDAGGQMIVGAPVAPRLISAPGH